MKCSDDSLTTFTMCAAAAKTNDEFREFARSNCPNSTTFASEINSTAFQLVNQDETVIPVKFPNNNSFVPYKRLQLDVTKY